MRQSVADELTIAVLSERVNLSPTRLRQLFKQETGHPPMHYLRNLRMQRAAELLRSTFLSVKEVTFVCGIRDVSGFVRHFKTQYGLTPSKFRLESDPSMSCSAKIKANVE